MKSNLRVASGPARAPRQARAFTLTEVMIAVGITGIAVAMASTFIVMATQGASGIVRQSEINDQASHASEFMFNRIRFATSTAVGESGNTLTLGFDDDYLVDSDHV